jgi:hypothetical protein
MLVAQDSVHRDELVVEPSGLRCRTPPLLRAEREVVLVRTGNLPALRDVLARLAHRLQRKLLLQDGIRKPPAECRVPHGLVPAREGMFRLRHHERRSAHRLDAAGDEEIAVSGGNRMTCRHDGAETGRAQPVDGHACDALGKAGKQHSHPRDVAIVFACLVRTAEVHVLDLLRTHAGAADGFLDRQRSEIVRPDVRECAAVPPDRRPHARDDHCPAHTDNASPGTPL